MHTEEDNDTTTDLGRNPAESGWSAIPTKKKSDTERTDDEKHEAEQQIYSEPDNPPAKQETGGPDKPTA